jgi:hypothetical protein
MKINTSEKAVVKSMMMNRLSLVARDMVEEYETMKVSVGVVGDHVQVRLK